MNWDAIGAIAEGVGALAVIITLIYLAVQIRVNSKQLERTVQATKVQSNQDLMQNFNIWRQMVLLPGNADIWRRGINDLGALSGEERIPFNMMAGAFVWSTWHMYRSQTIEGLVVDVNAHLWQDMFKHPGYRKWLETHRLWHTDEFGSFLDDVRQSVGAERLKPGEPSSLTAGAY